MGNLLDKIKTKLEFSKRDSKTFSGQPADDIQLHPSTGSIKEAAEKREVFTFGRFNPPTTGHKKLIDSVKSIADKQGAGHTIFASQTQDKAKNPLPHDEKVGFMKKMFPDTNIHGGGDVKTVLDAARHMQAKGVTHGTLVVGSDRVDEFHNLLSKYNKSPSDPDYDPTKHFHVSHLTVVSAGQRDPDAEGIEGMSASKLRSHAASGNFNEFKKGVPNKEHAQSMYDAIRKHMRISESLGSPAPERIQNIQRTADIAHDKQRAEHGRSSKRTVGTFVKKAKTLNITVPSDKSRMPADMTQNPYEETRYVIPFQRDNMTKDHAPVDVGYSKDLDSQDKNKQLKRRKALKLFRNYVEGSDGDTYGAAQDKAGGPIGSQLSNVSTSNALPKTVTKPKPAKKLTTEAKRGLWANIHAKRERIKHGSGEHMRKPGSEGAPTEKNLKDAAEETVHEMGMFGSDLAISDKPTAYPNISTPVPPVVAPKKKMKKEDNEPPFPGPYRPITSKDRFGNTIKPKNQAARLAKQGMKSVKTEETDEEGGMAKNELETAARAAKELGSKLKRKSQLPAWVQSKITKGSDQLDTVADYMKSNK